MAVWPVYARDNGCSCYAIFSTKSCRGRCLTVAEDIRTISSRWSDAMIAKAISLAVIWVMTTYATGASADEKPITAQEFAQLIVETHFRKGERERKNGIYMQSKMAPLFLKWKLVGRIPVNGR